LCMEEDEKKDKEGKEKPEWSRGKGKTIGVGLVDVGATGKFL
jgi:hypothetical protein